MSLAAAPRNAPPELWRIAQHFLNELYCLFGAPEYVAEQHTLITEPYKLLLRWLRAGEALMRRLLLIEASHYAKSNARPLLNPPRKRVRKPIGFNTEHPEKWRVGFRCLSSPARGGSVEARSVETKGDVTSVSLSPSKADRAHANRFHSAWPLAERYEALIRVFNDPAPYAKRLAQRLYATPHRAREVLRYQPGAPDIIGHEHFEALRNPCAGATRTFEPG